MNWSIEFIPVVPWPVLWIIAGIGAVLLAALFWRARRGAVLRLLTFAMLLLAMANPHLKQEDREPLNDIVAVVVDDSQSQAIAGRTEHTETVRKVLEERLKTLPDLETRFVRSASTSADNERDGTMLFTDLAQALADVPPDRLAGVVIPILSVGCGLIWTLALLVVSGRSLDMVTVALPPVVWVVGLATSIHLLARCQSRLRHGDGASEAIPDTLTTLGRPCLMSAVTTAIGFGALSVSSMPPVREMGVFAAVGVLCCLVSNFLLFPLLGRWWGRGAGRWRPRSAVASRMALLGEWVLEHSTAILVAAAALSLVALAGVLELRADSNVIEFFDEETEIGRTYERILPSLTGPYSMEVLLDGGIDSRSLESLRTLDALARRIEAEPGVARVLTVADFVKKASVPVEDSDAPWELPGTDAELAEAWERVDEHLGEEVRPLLGNRGSMRLSVIARPMGSGEHRALVGRLESMLDDPALAARRPRLTGVVKLLVELQDELVSSQVKSFTLAFLIIVPVIAIFFRSLVYAALSLPPNLVPVLLTLGFMGATGIPLNPATVMIAAIAFGIVVDDSIHFLSHYQQSRRSGTSAHAAVIDTLAAVGRPLWITSIVAASGFSVLCFSSFVPLFDFGLLSAGTMLAALAGNLLLLPALLARTARSP